MRNRKDPDVRKFNRETIVLRSMGQIAFPEEFLDRFNLTGYTHALVYYNKEKMQMGVDFTFDKEDDGARRVYPQSNYNRGTFVSVQSLFEEMNIHVPAAVHCPFKVKHGVFVFDIPEEYMMGKDGRFSYEESARKMYKKGMNIYDIAERLKIEPEMASKLV